MEVLRDTRNIIKSQLPQDAPHIQRARMADKLSDTLDRLKTQIDIRPHLYDSSGRASPIHIKKKLRRLSDGLGHRGMSSTLPAALCASDIREADRAWAKENAHLSPPSRSISRTSSVSSSSTLSRPILKRKYATNPRDLRIMSPKHVQFLSDVTVFQMGHDGQHVCTKCEQLNMEPKSRDTLTRRLKGSRLNYVHQDDASQNEVVPIETGSSSEPGLDPGHCVVRHGGAAVVTHAVMDNPNIGRARVGAVVTSSNASVSNGNQTVYPNNNNNSISSSTVYPSNNSISSSSSISTHNLPKPQTVSGPVKHINSDILPNSFSSHHNHGAEAGHINISFAQDAAHGTKLKFVVHIGQGYEPEDIVVKANMNGSRIRVMATKVMTRSDGSHDVQQFNERYVLPMDIDPFTVDARLDSKGNLTVEAPLMTLERRQSLVKDQRNESTMTLV